MNPRLIIFDASWCFIGHGGDFGLHVEGAGPKIPEGSVRIHGLDPSGASTILSEVPFSAPPNMSEIEINFDLPNELRARVTKVDVVGQSHIGANYVIADQLRRPKVGIIATTNSDETINVFDPMHFLKTAIEPFADLQIGTIEQLLLASPDILISADIVSIPNASAVFRVGARRWFINTLCRSPYCSSPLTHYCATIL